MKQEQKEYLDRLVLSERNALYKKRLKIINAIDKHKMRVARLQNLLYDISEEIEANESIPT